MRLSNELWAVVRGATDAKIEITLCVQHLTTRRQFELLSALNLAGWKGMKSPLDIDDCASCRATIYSDDTIKVVASCRSDPNDAIRDRIDTLEAEIKHLRAKLP